MVQLVRRLSSLPPPACLAAAGWLAACAPSPPPPDTVALSDLGAVTRSDLDAYILALPESERQPAPGQDVAAWRREVLEEHLLADALRAEAAHLLDAPEAQDLLASRREGVLAEAVDQRLVAAVPAPTEEELRAFYAAHPEDFSHPEQIRLRHIFLRVDRDAPAAERARAQVELETLRVQIRDGANFDELARLHSDSETARYDGLIGRLNRGALDPALEAVVWELDEGELSEVVPTAVGFHLFKLDDRLEPFVMDFAEARGRLERRLTNEALEAARRAYFAEFLTASAATYRPELVAAEEPETILFALAEDSLTAGELRSRLKALPFERAREKSPEGHLVDLARQRLCVWEAERQGLDRDAALAPALAEVERQLAVELARQHRRRMRLAAMSDAELEAFYEQRAERFRTARLLHLSILTRPFPAAQEEWYRVYEDLARVADDIRAGREDFAAAARRLSDDLSRWDGGDVGWVRLDSVGEWAGPTANNRVAGLAVGELSAPLLIERYERERLRYDRAGYFLVRLEGVQSPELRPLAEVREEVIASLVSRGDLEFDRQVRDEALAAVHARIFDDHL